jgi:hypothetical protein
MRKRVIHLLCSSLALPMAIQAQIVFHGSIPQRCFALNSLVSAGTKVICSNNSGASLFNMDLTPFLTFAYPPPPADFTYLGSASLFTEETFDTDPSTIELLVHLTGSSGANGIRVVRADGTILFEDLEHGMTGINSPTDLFSTGAFFQASDGMVYLQLVTPFGSPNPVETVFYGLPGVMPCLDCGSVGMGISPPTPTERGARLSIFPNPGSGLFTVTAELPLDLASARLVAYAADGREVWQGSIKNRVTLTVPMNAMSSGFYVFHLMHDDLRLAAQIVEVAR